MGTPGPPGTNHDQSSNPLEDLEDLQSNPKSIPKPDFR